MAAWIWYGPGWPRRRQPPDQGLPLGDEPGVPAAPVLVGQEHHAPVGRGPGRPPGLGQQHQREQSQDFRLVRHQRGQQPPEPDRLGAQVGAGQPVTGARRVPLVEDEVHHGQHGGQAAGQVGFARHAVGDPRVTDLALGPDETLGHGRLRDQERVRDLRGGQAAEQPEGQRDLGGRAERGMAAGEQQPEPVVAHGPLLGGFGARCFLAGLEQGGLGVPAGPRRFAAQPVDGLIPGGGDDPAGRAGRQAAGRPARRGAGEGVLDRVLGDVDVAEHADQDRDRPPVLLTEHPLDIRTGPGRGHDRLSLRRCPAVATPRRAGW